MREATSGWQVNDFPRPEGLQEATVDAFTGFKPSSWSRAQVAGAVPRRHGARATTPGSAASTSITGADGKDYRWQDGCAAASRSRKGYLVLNQVEEAVAALDGGQPGLDRARAPGHQRLRAVRTRTPPDPHDVLLPARRLGPTARRWGAPFPPTATCQPAPSPEPSVAPPSEPRPHRRAPPRSRRTSPPRSRRPTPEADQDPQAGDEPGRPRADPRAHAGADRPPSRRRRPSRRRSRTPEPSPGAHPSRTRARASHSSR